MGHKKVCFVTTRNIFNTSCLPRYAKLLNGKFDIIYWDQHGIEEECGAENHYRFKYVMSYGKSRLKKAMGYLKFRGFATQIIKKNDYDLLILLPTQAGLLLSSLLMTKYRGRYILDIRDYTAENNKIFYEWEKKLIGNSAFSVITSPAYRRFLPPHENIVSHNITRIDDNLVKKFRQKNSRQKEKIVISCIGSIRFIEQFKRVIRAFANDPRFELRFIGRGSEHLSEFCSENSINNVVLQGRFASEDTVGFYLDTDIIMNLYGNNNPFLDFALSNKLYYAATLGMPILVSPGTYMEEVAVENGFGFSCDLDSQPMPDKLHQHYCDINWKRFYDKCDKFMEGVRADEEFFLGEVRSLVD